MTYAFITESKTPDELKQFDRELNDGPRVINRTPAARVANPQVAEGTNALMAAFNMGRR